MGDSRTSEDFFRLLAAGGPYTGIEESRQLYAPLIGEWEIETTW